MVAPAPQEINPPVSTLPYELLEAIFSYAVCSTTVDFFPDSFASLHLSHVCSFWRFVAQSSPRLWTIDLHSPDVYRRFLPLVHGSGTPLHIVCSPRDTRALAWPDWLYSYVKDGGVKSISVKIRLPGLERFLKTVSGDLPDLEMLDVHAWQEWGFGGAVRISESLLMLRSLTISDARRPSERQYPLKFPVLDFVKFLHLCPFLETLRLEYVHLDDYSLRHAREHSNMDNELALMLPNLRKLTFTGTNRLNSILELVTVPATVTLELDDMGKLNLSGDLSAVTKRRLREAKHTHLIITTTAIQTSSDRNREGIFRFSRLRKHEVLFHALVSYGRAFQWSASITHLSLNPDGKMFSTLTHDEESWDEMLAPAWQKLFRALGELTRLTITGFVADEVFKALHPDSKEKAGVVRVRVPCSKLETIVLKDFQFVESGAEAEDGASEGYAPLAVECLAEMLVARKREGKQMGRLILSNCLNGDTALNSLREVVSMPSFGSV